MEQNYFQTLCMGLYHNLGVALQAKQSDIDIKKYGNKFIIILDGEELTLYPANNGNPHDLYIGELDYMGTPQALSAAILGDEQEIARVTQHQGDNIVESGVSFTLPRDPQNIKSAEENNKAYKEGKEAYYNGLNISDNPYYKDPSMLGNPHKIQDETSYNWLDGYQDAQADDVKKRKDNIVENNGGPFAPFGNPKKIENEGVHDEKAYQRGIRAYRNGSHPDNNPYDPNSNLAYSWLDGWEDANNDDVDLNTLKSLFNEMSQKQADTKYEEYVDKCKKLGKKCLSFAKWLDGKSIAENLLREVEEDSDKIKVKKSQQQYNDYTKAGKKIKSTDVFDIYLREDNRLGKIYTFVETQTKLPEGQQPMVYVYSLGKGNLSRGAGHLWARQELRSTSFAFHKDNPNKTAIPNDLKLALKIATNNLNNFRAKSKNNINEALVVNSVLKSAVNNAVKTTNDIEIESKQDLVNAIKQVSNNIVQQAKNNPALKDELDKMFLQTESMSSEIGKVGLNIMSNGLGMLIGAQMLNYHTLGHLAMGRLSKAGLIMALGGIAIKALSAAYKSINYGYEHLNEEAQIDADLDEIYAKGSAAYELGVEKEDNPYGYDDNVQAGVWEQGWESAQELDLKYGGKSAIAYQDALQEGLVIESRTLEAIYDKGIEDYYKGLRREENPYQDANDPDAPDNDNVYAGFWQEGWEAAAQQENPNWSNDFYNKPITENKRVIKEAKIKFEMTGSPKEDGYDTKSEFTNLLDDNKVEHTNIKNADVLVMGDWSPNNIKQHRGEGGKFTGKMSNKADYAKKHGIKTMSYKDFVKKYGKKNIKESIDTQGQQGINESNQQYFILRHKNKVTGDHHESQGMSREDAMTELGLWKKYIESGNKVPHEGYQPDLLEKWVNGDDVYWIEPVKQSKMKSKKLSEEQQLVYLDGAEAAQVGLNSLDNPHTNGDFENYKLWEEGFKSDGKLLVENEDRDERLKNDQAKKLKQFSFDDFKGNAAYKNLLASGFKENYIGFKTASEQLIELTNDKVKLDLYFYPTHSIMDENKKKYVIFFRIEPKYQKIFEIRSTGESKAKKQKLITTACTFIIEKLKQKKLIHESFVEYEVEDDVFVKAVTNWYRKNKGYYEDYSDLLYHFSEAFPGHDISELEAIVEDVDDNDAKFMKDMEDWHSKRYPTNNTDDDEDWTDPAGGVHSADDKEPWKMYESLNKLIDKKLLTESSRHHFVMGGVNNYSLKQNDNALEEEICGVHDSWDGVDIFVKDEGYADFRFKTDKAKAFAKKHELPNSWDDITPNDPKRPYSCAVKKKFIKTIINLADKEGLVVSSEF